MNKHSVNSHRILPDVVFASARLRCQLLIHVRRIVLYLAWVLRRIIFQRDDLKHKRMALGGHVWLTKDVLVG
jgi:hypothetical protein